MSSAWKHGEGVDDAAAGQLAKVLGQPRGPLLRIVTSLDTQP